MKSIVLRNLILSNRSLLVELFINKLQTHVLSKNTIGLISGLFLLSACGLTHSPQVSTNHENIERMDSTCIAQVNNSQNLPLTELSQYLSLANAAMYCVGEISYSPRHPDVKTAMQFNALAVMNYIKAGDIHAAKNAFIAFRATFPQQDLMFADYSSFVDTATVLLGQQELNQQQLTMLNINPSLRAEIKRQRRWAIH